LLKQGKKIPKKYVQELQDKDKVNGWLDMNKK